MVSCRVSGCTNRSDKNSNIITLVTMIMLLQLFRILPYLMSESYSKPTQISKMMKQVENPDIVKAVYSDIFKHIQGLLPIFSHVQAY